MLAFSLLSCSDISSPFVLTRTEMDCSFAGTISRNFCSRIVSISFDCWLRETPGPYRDLGVTKKALHFTAEGSELLNHFIIGKSPERGKVCTNIVIIRENGRVPPPTPLAVFRLAPFLALGLNVDTVVGNQLLHHGEHAPSFAPVHLCTLVEQLHR